MSFRDRIEAGRRLAERLGRFAGEAPLVLALPRGGVPVAREVASALDAPLDVLVVRKLGVPTNPDLGFGAVAEDGAVYLDRLTVAMASVSEREVGRTLQEAEAEVARRASLYRAGRGRLPVGGKTVLLVDDGVATGGTIRAALGALQRAGAGKVILAAPVITRGVAEALRPLVAELVFLEEHGAPGTVSHAYGDFRLLRDADVVALLGSEQATGSGAPA